MHAPGQDTATTVIVEDAGTAEGWPSVERQRELEALYELNLRELQPPYAGVEIHAKGELLWIMERRGWSGLPDGAGSNAADLRRCVLSDADLSGVHLRYADLTGAFVERCNMERAFFERANLQGAFFIGHTTLANAILEGANLSETYLHKSDLSDADLAGANLRSARLVRTNLHGAIMQRVDLQGAHLRRADLRGTYLNGARMNEHTVLHNVLLDEHTRLGDVVWGGAALTSIDWTTVRKFGDESVARKMRTAAQRTAAYRDAARMYRDLVTALEHQGLSTPASKFRLRVNHVERKALFWNREVRSWAFSSLLNGVAGYGERPGRTFTIYLCLILGFALGYYSMDHTFGLSVSGSQADLSFVEACVLSITAFHGRGFFQTPLNLGDPVGIVAAVEAVIGLFIEALFVASFSRRFLSN
jgi:uncharacterized protein YjbI with pentapeptide repeats